MTKRTKQAETKSFEPREIRYIKLGRAGAWATAAANVGEQAVEQAGLGGAARSVTLGNLDVLISQLPSR